MFLEKHNFLKNGASLQLNLLVQKYEILGGQERVTNP